MIHLRLNLDPVPASRPRVSKWGTYYGKRHQAFRKEALASFDDMRERGLLPEVLLSGGLQVWAAFYIRKPKTTKLKTPRGDIDNYLKLLLDCATGYIWEDDTQVEKVCGYKEFATGDGSIDLWVKETTDDTVRIIQHPETASDSEGHDKESLEEAGFYLCPRGFTSLPH